MKYSILITCVSTLLACSSEVAPLPSDDDRPPAWPAWTEDGGGSVSLRDAGPEPDSALDGSGSNPDAGEIAGDAGDGTADAMPPETQTDAGSDSGAEVEKLLHDRLVGTWSGAESSAGHPCGEEITIDTVQCPTALECSPKEISIDATYAIDPAEVTFVRWEYDVWIGAYDDDFHDDHRTLRLWLINEDTMLGEYSVVDDPTIGTVCVPWKLTRQ